MRDLLANVDIGDGGQPGSSAELIQVRLYQIGEGRYEALGKHSTGSNQGHYEENTVYGPWRGRGNDLPAAISEMLNIVEEDHYRGIHRAAQEALYDAEDNGKDGDGG